jgi:phosphoserine/homoserine phosphotransferase
MKIVCLDLEGVLIPEIWICVADATGVDELRLTTRDISDYDELMRHRLRVLDARQIRLPDIQSVIADVKPLEGAVAFLDDLRAMAQVAILSDTFHEFTGPIMPRLGWPMILCNKLETDESGRITGYRLRQKDGKKTAVQAFRSLNLRTVAAGDSFNDISMIRSADAGVLFRPSDAVVRAHPDLPVAHDYPELLAELRRT